MQHVTIVGKIIEHALTGNLDSVRAYGDLLVTKLREDGDDRAAQLLQDKLDGKVPDLVIEGRPGTVRNPQKSDVTI